MERLPGQPYAWSVVLNAKMRTRSWLLRLVVSFFIFIPSIFLLKLFNVHIFEKEK